MTQAHCNNCGRSTNHDLIAAESRDELVGDEDDEDPLVWSETYEMLKCRGCDNVTFRRVTRNGLQNREEVVYYPPAVARRVPEWLQYEGLDALPELVPSPIRSLMHEVYTAAQNNSRELAAMGIRAVLERVMLDKVGDQGNFKTTLLEFHRAGYLSNRNADTLETVLEAGHAATHRGWTPTAGDFATLLDITENIIDTVYLHEPRAHDLERNVPKRPRPSRKTP